MRRNLTFWLALGALSFALSGCRSGESTDTATVNEPTEGEATGAAEAAGHQFDPEDRWGLADSPARGAEDALVTIVEFSDFQCPFCSRVLPTLEQIMETEEFAGKVRIVFHQMPLPMHPGAHLGHQAALAAHAQGKFWEMHDILFMAENRQSMSREDLIGYATTLELDVAAFTAALDDETYKAQVDEEVALASTLGIRGTPNFMVNGRNVRGAQPFAAFETIIREEIVAMEALIEGGKSVGEAYGLRLDENVSAAPAAAAAAPARQARPQPDPAAELFVPVGDSPFKGPENALITIIEFSEFQCPYCSRVNPTMAQVVETYGDDVRIVFKHNPLGFHDRAIPAALASIAAQNQGKFWEFHDIAFQNQRALTDENFEAWAEQLGLNMDRFRADIADPANTTRVTQEQALAQRLAAGGTPHFFVNGTRLRGAQPFEAFQRVIDAELVKARAAIAAGASPTGIYEHLQSDAERGAAPMIQPPAAAAPAAAARPAAPAGPVEINIGDAPTRGPEGAPVTLVIWTDFECPYCGRFANSVDEALVGYEDRVRVVLKAYPLPMHRNAPLAHQASLAAHAQGKFWEFHDVLFENRSSLDRAGLERHAETVGLNMTEFRAALDNGTYAAAVTAQMAEGQAVGVRGTPGWFVNGMTYSGARPASAIQAAFDQALEAAE
ncbi:MAG: protein-disulfide isomerase [Bradymonadia bacterium]|jgi:protein-disulfide isomerase